MAFEYLPRPAASPTAVFDESLKRSLFRLTEPRMDWDEQSETYRNAAASGVSSASWRRIHDENTCAVCGSRTFRPADRGDRNRLGITRKCYRD